MVTPVETATPRAKNAVPSRGGGQLLGRSEHQHHQGEEAQLPPEKRPFARAQDFVRYLADDKAASDKAERRAQENASGLAP